MSKLSAAITSCGCITLIQTDTNVLSGALITEQSSVNPFSEDYQPFLTEDGNNYLVPENFSDT